MKNILITGVAGFIGSSLAERLIEENFNVIGIDNLSYGIRDQVPKGVDFQLIDIRGKEIYKIMKDVDYVFHFAYKNDINNCQSDPLEAVDINVNGTMNIFEAAKQNNIKKIIYADSFAMYEGSNLYPTPEFNIKPQSFFALSKMCAYILSKGYMRFSNLKFTGLRYFCVYGPKQNNKEIIPNYFITKLLKNQEPIIYGDGEKKQDFIHIDDINDFHMKCILDERTDNSIFNLGGGKNYSINEIYEIISGLLNSNIKPIYKNDVIFDSLQNLADISEAKKLGWSPKINLKKGLKISIDFIKKEIEKEEL